MTIEVDIGVGKKVCSLFSVGLNELVSVFHIIRRKYWKLGNIVTENDDTLTLTLSAMSIKKKDKRHRVFQTLDEYVKNKNAQSSRRVIQWLN